MTSPGLSPATSAQPPEVGTVDIRQDTPADVASRARLLRETAEHHDHYEKTHAPHNWWDWYSAYFGAREHGRTPDEAVEAANRYMDEVLHVAAL